MADGALAANEATSCARVANGAALGAIGVVRAHRLPDPLRPLQGPTTIDPVLEVETTRSPHTRYWLAYNVSIADTFEATVLAALPMTGTSTTGLATSLEVRRLSPGTPTTAEQQREQRYSSTLSAGAAIGALPWWSARLVGMVRRVKRRQLVVVGIRNEPSSNLRWMVDNPAHQIHQGFQYLLWSANSLHLAVDV